MKKAFRTEHYRFEYTESDKDTPVLWERHCHSSFEMIGVLDGSVTVMPEGKSYVLDKGDVAIIPPLCYHTVSASRNRRYCRVTALFHASAVPSALQSCLLDSGEVTVLPFDGIDELGRLCTDERAAYYAPLAEAQMVRLLYAHAAERKSRTREVSDEFLGKTLAYIDCHLDRPIMLCELAEHVSRSQSSLSHLFEEKMQISPKQYILQKKMAYAKSMIADGVPPTVAAAKVGYENYSNFYRIYKKHYGKAPTEH